MGLRRPPESTYDSDYRALYSNHQQRVLLELKSTAKHYYYLSSHSKRRVMIRSTTDASPPLSRRMLVLIEQNTSLYE